MSVASVLKDKRLWLAVAAILAILALRFTGLGELLSLDTLRTHRAALTGWVEQNKLLAALAFVGAYAAAVGLSIPGAIILTLTGGFLFGGVVGTALTVTGATLGATLVFLFARTIFGDRALDRFGSTAEKLATGIRANAWSYLLVLRLVPVFPFFLVNLVPAFVGVRLPTYVLTTFFGIMPGTAVYSFAGAGLGRVFDQGGAFDIRAILTPELLIALCGLALLSLVAIPLKNRFAKPQPAEAPARADVNPRP